MFILTNKVYKNANPVAKYFIIEMEFLLYVIFKKKSLDFEYVRSKDIFDSIKSQ